MGEKGLVVVLHIACTAFAQDTSFAMMEASGAMSMIHVSIIRYEYKQEPNLKQLGHALPSSPSTRQRRNRRHPPYPLPDLASRNL